MKSGLKTEVQQIWWCIFFLYSPLIIFGLQARPGFLLMLYWQYVNKKTQVAIPLSTTIILG